MSWSCAAGYTVDAVYTLQPSGAFVTKALRIGSASAHTTDFYVLTVTPWTQLSVVPAGATVPASWLIYKNGFSKKEAITNAPEIAGFARFPELSRGIFVTVQNPFGKYSDGPATSPFAPSVS